ncbi:hypothetical protein DY000_02047124 [Brassica cretica]|uniref:Uncharacterized protein n=1 Tax=Brassica cretica TaxID=69181 RepID=A0ABQ7F7B3_BRACR|nr:hypothetical protein DY000_02047124 [Brassica cretica]
MAENMKWVRYGLRETASKGRRECMDSCRIDVSEELGRYVALLSLWVSYIALLSLCRMYECHLYEMAKSV